MSEVNKNSSGKAATLATLLVRINSYKTLHTSIKYNSALIHTPLCFHMYPLCTTQTQPHSHSSLTLTHRYTLELQLRKLLAH